MKRHPFTHNFLVTFFGRKKLDDQLLRAIILTVSTNITTPANCLTQFSWCGTIKFQFIIIQPPILKCNQPPALSNNAYHRCYPEYLNN